MTRRCPIHYGTRLIGFWCHICEYDYTFCQCSTCRVIYIEESDAGDCEYSHRTVLDDVVDAVKLDPS